MFSPLLSCSTVSCVLYNRTEHRSRGFFICYINCQISKPILAVECKELNDCLKFSQVMLFINDRFYITINRPTPPPPILIDTLTKRQSVHGCLNILRSSYSTSVQYLFANKLEVLSCLALLKNILYKHFLQTVTPVQLNSNCYIFIRHGHRR